MNRIKKWWLTRKLKKMENDLYWLEIEYRGIKSSPYAAILYMNIIVMERDIEELKNTLSGDGK